MQRRLLDLLRFSLQILVDLSLHLLVALYCEPLMVENLFLFGPLVRGVAIRRNLGRGLSDEFLGFCIDLLDFCHNVVES